MVVAAAAGLIRQALKCLPVAAVLVDIVGKKYLPHRSVVPKRLLSEAGEPLVQPLAVMGGMVARHLLVRTVRLLMGMVEQV